MTHNLDLKIDQPALLESPAKPSRSYANVIVVGLPGSGKSTVGRHLAVILGLGFIDLDIFIEESVGKSVEAIWKDDGEESFRQAERAALEKISGIQSHVIALGGGALQDQFCVDLVRSLGPIVWLRPSPDEVARRLYMKVSELEKRPMFSDMVGIEDKDERRQKIKERVAGLSDRRSAMYQHADIVLDGGYVTPETSACQLKEIMTSMNYRHGRVGSYEIWKGQV